MTIDRLVQPDTDPGFDPEDVSSNPSTNRPFRDVLAARVSRRNVMRSGIVGPRGAEITGVITTPDQRTMFVNVQHPGGTTTAWGTPNPVNPRAVSNWPDFDPVGRPRSATAVIRKHDGGVIGT